MPNPIRTTQFKKDYKLALKRGKDIGKLHDVISKLVAGESLAPKHKDHPLTGSYLGRRECHVEPDWLLVYKVDGSDIIFERAGTHSDLFK